MKIPSFGEEKPMLERIWGTFLYRIAPESIIERVFGAMLRPIQKVPDVPK